MAQLRFPRMPGGANRVALVRAQENFVTSGVVEQGRFDRVRAPRAGDLRDVDWRPLESGRDYMEEPRRGVRYGSSYPEDTTVLYYWRGTFWHSQLA